MTIVDVASVLGELKAYNAINAELDRLRSENAELRAALETLLYRATELPQYATHDGLMNSEAIAQARAILERTMK